MKRVLSATSESSEVDPLIEGTPLFENPLFDEEKEPMAAAAAADRTLKELAASAVNQQPLSIVYPEIAGAFELKSGLIHLLPNFHGFAGEDPYKHLKELHVVCSSFKPQGVTEEHVKLRAFPFSLKDKAKDWLYYLPEGSIRTWDEMKQTFLEKFFTASRAANIRKDICGIRQFSSENLDEYWERFNQLCASCPQHQIPDQLLIQYFYEGLLPANRRMIDAASGGALVNKTPAAARELISNMAENTQQYGAHADEAPKRVNEVHTSTLESQMADLTALVRQLATGQVSNVRVCGICAVSGHPTDMCPTLQEDQVHKANVIGGFLNQPQRRYDPYSNQYNPGWR
ncbi:retrotransposon gag family protein, partial [Candidatus Burkholderia verschuerenii]|uniref:retrotransposon gag family protein n=1 Tax=Candidatus Burkholderia verschuerenii TaxID=242163 RepID=UPI0018DC387B